MADCYESSQKYEKNDFESPAFYSYVSKTKTKWKPVSFTFVQYPEGDIYGKFLAWLSLAPVFIIVGFVAVIIFRRELHTMAYFFGCLLNYVLSVILKNIVKEPRPCDGPISYHTEFGMPSSHSSFVAFFSCYALLFIYFGGTAHLAPSVINSYCRQSLASSNVFRSNFSNCFVSYGRIYLHYHTTSQVLCGIVLGLSCGIVWFLVVHHVLTEWFPVITSWKISEFFLIRDSTRIPSILWFEYTRAREEETTKKKIALN
ncbi:dolichyldiphosphatase 1-like [Xenia sp. Carnegie-2017]|uniref:dolichyldiphosphatase 1-like n=1 Tax=Xenia sp. Carnegie-2017 TaxID=2897299 RepID=UPI001F048FAE|nr:dolichyldiphosphatase 1-like [Xenia sp. Carnegie-2017]